MAIIYDAGSGFIDTELCEHRYTYNGPSGALDSDTCVADDGVTFFKKTYTFFQNDVIKESRWIKQ